VQAGETLTSIAKQNKLYVADLKKWNDLKDNNIKLGDKIKLNGTNAVLASNDKPSIETIFYTVKKGDNISVIATLNNVSVNNIKDWNNLNSNTVKVGEKLKIEKTITEVAEVSKKAKKDKFKDVRFYTVQKGDSLYSISLKNNITVAEIKRNNDIEDENIMPGMKLKI
jgi:membrane-bound lytic murein transglycosylase D